MLMEADVGVMSNRDCKRVYKKDYKKDIAPYMLCAQDFASGEDSGQGDVSFPRAGSTLTGRAV